MHAPVATMLNGKHANTFCFDFLSGSMSSENETFHRKRHSEALDPGDNGQCTCLLTRTGRHKRRWQGGREARRVTLLTSRING